MVIHGAAAGISPTDIHRTTESIFNTGNGRVIGAPLRMRRPEDQSPSAASAGLMMEVWASVASWFLRPEMAGASVPPIVPQPPPMPIRPSRTSSDPPQMAMPPTICTAIRCTVPGCVCDCFTPGKLHIRFCDACGHGWVPHALDKLGFGGASLGNGAVEPIQPNVAFDIASLVLYGCQALPIRLKILLDRLFSVLRQDEVSAVLRGFGWTHEDYARGYILQEPHGGGILERWNICSPEEEPLVLQQFLRFGETRAVTQQLLLHGLSADFRALPGLETDMKRLMERQKLQHNHDQKPSFEPKFRPRSPSALLPPQRLPSALGSSPPSPPKSTFGFAKPPGAVPPIPPVVNTNGGGSPSNTSPTSVSPLNKLQNMQPFDFRKMQSAGFAAGGKPERRNSDLLPPPPRPNQNDYNNSSKYATQSDSLAGSSEFGSEDGDEEEENSQSALNLSKDNSSKSTRPHRGHLRKTSLPLKRQWGSSGLPLNLGTQLINPATGKKRVQCNVCLKTFCDKGALKIHFSAVHLREMHKCTVEGCNMMFSSRRSRNRHSANPNPKLHSPHLRRKISPHDGRSSQAHHPIVISPLQASAMNQLAFGAFPMLAGGADLRAAGSKQSSSSGLHLADELRRSADFSSDNMDEYMDDEEDGIVVDGTTVDDDDDSEHRSDRSKRMSEESEDDGASTTEPPNNNNDRPPIVTKNVHKRKSQNPTRFAAAADLSDEGMSCTDDGSAPSPKDNNNEEDVKPVVAEGECLNLSRKRSASPADGRLRSADSRDSLLSDADDDDDGEDDECGSDSDGHVYGVFENGRFVETEEVPVDKDDPRKCTACGKTFPNHFGVKTHYQNVHLKLMHKCVVDGCNAAFPSKRSRDRHSSNLNLHRKLLSTSPTASDQQQQQPQPQLQLHQQQLGHQPPVTTAAAVAAAAAAVAADNPYGMHAEFLARLYADTQQFQAFSNGGMMLPQFGPFRHQAGAAAMTNGWLVYSADEDLPASPDKDSGMYSCRFCSKAFPDKNGMREHYEQLHMHEMHRCKVQGCGLVFSSRTRRNAHAENHPPVTAS